MSATWPGALPQDQFLGTTYGRVNNRLRSNMDAGPAKMRRRYTARIKTIDAPLVLTGAELKILEAWYENEIGDGTLPFIWEHPLTDVVVEFRFREELQPFRLDVGGGVDDRVWIGTLKLEIMP